MRRVRTSHNTVLAYFILSFALLSYFLFFGMCMENRLMA